MLLVIAAGAGAVVKSPIAETPKLSRLNASVCAPIVGWVRLPYRPSKRVPYRSTRKL